MNQIKAVWLEQYDWRSDKVYSRPCCPDCEEPIIYSEGQYVCKLCDFANRKGGKQWLSI